MSKCARPLPGLREQKDSSETQKMPSVKQLQEIKIRDMNIKNSTQIIGLLYHINKPPPINISRTPPGARFLSPNLGSFKRALFFRTRGYYYKEIGEPNAFFDVCIFASARLPPT